MPLTVAVKCALGGERWRGPDVRLGSELTRARRWAPDTRFGRLLGPIARLLVKARTRRPRIPGTILLPTDRSRPSTSSSACITSALPISDRPELLATQTLPTGSMKVRSPARTPIASVLERSSAELSTASEFPPYR